MPSSSSTNAPYFVILTTFPRIRAPSGYFSSTASHGEGVSCLRPRLILSFFLSYFNIFTLISSPILSISPGCLILDQDISVICSKPSRPPRSMNTPKSVIFLTIPRRTCSSSISERRSWRLELRSSSRTMRLLTTIFLRILFSLITRKSIF